MIAQIIADIFQCTADRLEVSGSVALGGAMRAAVQNLEVSLDELEKMFCSQRGHTISANKANAVVYDAALSELQAMLIEL
jgi:sugar (pentulose or hexulose) kinase